MSTWERDDWEKGVGSHLNTPKPRLPGYALPALALIFQLIDSEVHEASLKQPPKGFGLQMTRRLLLL